MYDGPVQDLIDELGRMPGIGPKSAQRIAFHLLKLPSADALRLSQAIIEAKERVGFCKQCFNVSVQERCVMCSDPRREDGVLCVVEEPLLMLLPSSELRSSGADITYCRVA